MTGSFYFLFLVNLKQGSSTDPQHHNLRRFPGERMVRRTTGLIAGFRQNAEIDGRSECPLLSIIDIRVFRKEESKVSQRCVSSGGDSLTWLKKKHSSHCGSQFEA